MKVLIERMSHDGKGICYVDNVITFVPFVYIGEEVEIEVVKKYKKYNEAKLIKVITPSIKRVDSPCPYYTKCGGCNLMHISYSEQLNYKKEKVKNILNRYTNINGDIEIVPSNKEFNYRNKITLHESGEGIGYVSVNNDKVINIKKCLLVDDKINNSLGSALVYRTNGKEVICKENETLIMNINNYKFKIDINSFFQVNSYICGCLFNEIDNNLDNVNKVLDLYSGVGTLGIVASKKANEVISIEVNKYSYNNALENIKLNNVNNLKALCGKVEDLITSINDRIDVIITDPPRSGMDNKTIDVIKRFLPSKIIYISCEALTLARDIKLLSDIYEVKKIKLFDMFPNTSHVETFCVLERNYERKKLI